MVDFFQPGLLNGGKCVANPKSMKIYFKRKKKDQVSSIKMSNNSLSADEAVQRQHNKKTLDNVSGSKWRAADCFLFLTNMLLWF